MVGTMADTRAARPDGDGGRPGSLSAAGPSGAAIAFVLFVAGAFLRVRLSDAALGLALFAGAVSILGGADARFLAAFCVARRLDA